MQTVRILLLLLLPALATLCLASELDDCSGPVNAVWDNPNCAGVPLSYQCLPSFYKQGNCLSFNGGSTLFQCHTNGKGQGELVRSTYLSSSCSGPESSRTAQAIGQCRTVAGTTSVMQLCGKNDTRPAASQQSYTPGPQMPSPTLCPGGLASCTSSMVLMQYKNPDCSGGVVALQNSNTLPGTCYVQQGVMGFAASNYVYSCDRGVLRMSFRPNGCTGIPSDEYSFPLYNGFSKCSGGGTAYYCQN